MEPTASSDGTWSCRLVRPLTRDEEVAGLLYVVVARDRAELAALMALEDDKAGRYVRRGGAAAYAAGRGSADRAADRVADRAAVRAGSRAGDGRGGAGALEAEQSPSRVRDLEAERLHLEALRGLLLGRERFVCRVVAGAAYPDPYLRVVNLGCARLAEDVRCRASGGGFVFVWSWGDDIGAVDDLPAVAAAVVRVLSPGG
ncbi:hypothetical protein [Actinomadura atramentaria]|uniref:hypothetical protein n=1 Tax=Actinomadura atramentaria TaxID=1990 RepID=UPI0012FB637A|nr:hypothetical protein [Actinomadura atramentaria]